MSAETLDVASEPVFKCCLCDKEFCRKDLLKAHERRIHKIYASATKPEKPFKFECDYCDKMFRNYSSRSRHRIAVHNKKKIVKMEGGIEFKFNTEKEFKDWLASEEEKSKFHFIIGSSRKQGPDRRELDYICNRSGKFSSVSTGKRKMKAQGTNKIGKHCSAKILYKFNAKEAPAVRITYFREHNHEPSLKHLPLPTAVKEIIAEKLLNGECYSKIISDVRGSVEDPESRVHLITKKDIQNIKASLKLDTEPSKSPPEFNPGYSPYSYVSSHYETLDRNADYKTEVISKLASLIDKVKCMPGVSEATSKSVINALQDIETSLDQSTFLQQVYPMCKTRLTNSSSNANKIEVTKTKLANLPNALNKRKPANISNASNKMDVSLNKLVHFW
ncbi:hypothetical protein JTE90_020697 [Oedothorax gibbosus]|uniref:C2H2-type domain-containing protein n=1 Tax=Oedothorax gibbosus TaxID=931172 RepID=A0AAV6V3Z7_9ARAC|nr:hypothetical protein JTE90_020697 [Oedothorax gibbosus]